MTDALVRDPFLHGRNGVLYGHTVEEAGVHHDAGIILERERLLGDVAALHDLDDGQTEFCGKLPVALIVSRNAHNGAGAVAHKDIVRNKNGNLFLRRGVDGTHPFKTDAGFVLVQLAALKIGFMRGFLAVRRNDVPVGELVLPHFQHRMLRRKDHVRNAEKRVAAGGIYRKRIAERRAEGKLRALASADPVALLDLHAGDEIHVVQIVDQAVGILRDGKHPLALLAPDDRAAAALAHAVYDLLVCQHALAARTPVDRHGGFVRKSLFIHPQEDPLGPLIVLGVGRINNAVPVE